MHTIMYNQTTIVGRAHPCTPGSRKVKVAPSPGLLLTSISPPCSWMILWVNARPRPVPLSFGGEKWIEYALFYGLVHAHPGVRELNQYPIFHRFSPDGELASIKHGLLGVDGQIGKSAHQMFLISPELR